MTIFLIFSNSINPGDTHFMQKKTLQKSHVVDVAIHLRYVRFFLSYTTFRYCFVSPLVGSRIFRKSIPHILRVITPTGTHCQRHLYVKFSTDFTFMLLF